MRRFQACVLLGQPAVALMLFKCCHTVGARAGELRHSKEVIACT
jgi:hypothetical protein